MPRPVSDAIADGLPLWDTYEAVFFLVTGIFLGLVFGFLFPSLWRSFRRKFRRVDKYTADKFSASGPHPLFRKSPLAMLPSESEDDNLPDFDLLKSFVAARHAVLEHAYRDAANLYLQILGSEKVSRVQTNRAMFELTQVYAMSGLTSRAIDTGLELLHRKPAQQDVFRLLVSLCASAAETERLGKAVDLYSGPRAFELSREVAHHLSNAAAHVLACGSQQSGITLAKLAVRWSPAALEPKLALISATSVLRQFGGELPADQSALGFFVDLGELLRLFRIHPSRAAFLNFNLLRHWRDFFDLKDEEITPVFTRMKVECLNQIAWEQNASDCEFAESLSFFLAVLCRKDDRRMTAAGWEKVFAEFFPALKLTLDEPKAFVCGSCSALQRHYHWKCRDCQSWDSLVVWRP